MPVKRTRKLPPVCGLLIEVISGVCEREVDADQV